VIAKTVQFAAKAALLAWCSTALARQLPARATPIPNGVELISGHSRLDVQILEDRVVGVHVQLDSTSTPRTLVMGPHPGLRRPSFVKHCERDGAYTLATSGLLVRIQEPAPYLFAQNPRRCAPGQHRRPAAAAQHWTEADG
jgi:hypothetical protein